MYGNLQEQIEAQFVSEGRHEISEDENPSEYRQVYIERRWEEITIKEFVEMLDYMGFEIKKKE